MIVENVVLLIVAGVFTVLALVLGFAAAVEVTRIVREIATQAAEGTARTPDGSETSDWRRAGSPGEGAEGEHPFTPYRNREVVERLITHFEEGEVDASGGRKG
jgi:hypothetical protein